MIVKGIVSAIYTQEKKLSVILPEHDNITTNPLPIYGNPNMSDYSINDFVMVVAFNDDLTDGIVLDNTVSGNGGGGGGLATDLPLSVVDGKLCVTFSQD